MLTNSHEIFSQCQNDLNLYGYCIVSTMLSSDLTELVKNQNYQKIDNYFQHELSAGGTLFKQLSTFYPTKEIEFIISLREATNDWEEDGIWHDDGSRNLAFSLSLTLSQPEGGYLELRKKGDKLSTYLITPPFGEMIVFKTGQDNFEHKINAVTEGSRLIIAGWLTAHQEVNQ